MNDDVESSTVAVSATSQIRDAIERAVEDHFATGRHGMSLHACGTAVAMDVIAECKRFRLKRAVHGHDRTER